MGNNETLQELLGRLGNLVQEQPKSEYSYLDKLAEKQQEYSKAKEALGPNDPLVKQIGEEGSKYTRLVQEHYFNNPMDIDNVIPSLKRDIGSPIDLEGGMQRTGALIDEQQLDRDFSNKIINSGDRLPIEGIMNEKSYGF